jgi:hypothetical protein
VRPSRLWSGRQNKSRDAGLRSQRQVCNESANRRMYLSFQISRSELKACEIIEQMLVRSSAPKAMPIDLIVEEFAGKQSLGKATVAREPIPGASCQFSFAYKSSALNIWPQYTPCLTCTSCSLARSLHKFCPQVEKLVNYMKMSLPSQAGSCRAFNPNTSRKALSGLLPYKAFRFDSLQVTEYILSANRDK